MRRDNRKPRVTPYLFAAVWELAPSVQLVAHTLQRPIRQVLAWERLCRRAGIPLKQMPDRRLALRILDFTAPHAN